MKKDFGSKTWIFPMPVLMIGTYDEKGVANMMNAAWGGCSLEDEISICIDNTHKTWANIAAKKAFTVAFGTVKTVRECDYLGIVSGNSEPDKLAKCGFTVTKSKFVDAPVVNELPLVLECELRSIDEESCRVVGKIVNTAADESILADGKVDIAKLQPLCFDTCAHAYNVVGEKIAAAFSCGKEIAKGGC